MTYIIMAVKFAVAVAFAASWTNSFALAFTPLTRLREATFLRFSVETTVTKTLEEVDVIVVGAGIGGLSCAALCSKYGLNTLCLEAHDTPGGCAHSFSRFSSVSKDVPFKFDSGPSLCSGLSSQSTNPLRQVLDAIGTADEIDWFKYDGWLVHDSADGTSFKLTTGNGGK
jgi:cation diffusion facilitator CzcD-associated flavoprotein CzcO